MLTKKNQSQGIIYYYSPSENSFSVEDIINQKNDVYWQEDIHCPNIKMYLAGTYLPAAIILLKDQYFIINPSTNKNTLIKITDPISLLENNTCSHYKILYIYFAEESHSYIYFTSKQLEEFTDNSEVDFLTDDLPNIDENVPICIITNNLLRLDNHYSNHTNYDKIVIFKFIDLIQKTYPALEHLDETRILIFLKQLFMIDDLDKLFTNYSTDVTLIKQMVMLTYNIVINGIHNSILYNVDLESSLLNDYFDMYCAIKHERRVLDYVFISSELEIKKSNENQLVIINSDCYIYDLTCLGIDMMSNSSIDTVSKSPLYYYNSFKDVLNTSEISRYYGIVMITDGIVISTNELNIPYVMATNYILYRKHYGVAAIGCIPPVLDINYCLGTRFMKFELNHFKMFENILRQSSVNDKNTNILYIPYQLYELLGVFGSIDVDEHNYVKVYYSKDYSISCNNTKHCTNISHIPMSLYEEDYANN